MKNVHILCIAIVIILLILSFVITSKERFTNAVSTCGNNGGSGWLPTVNNDTSLTKSFTETNLALSINTENGNLSSAPAIPVGGIIMWAGTVDPPEGWAICDGRIVDQISTPDLRGRFIVGANTTLQTATISSGLSTYNIGDYGGEELHTLTIEEMPAHTHKYQYLINSGGNGTGNDWQTAQTTDTGSAGGSQPHNNLPPFYALVYIMKVY
jgi:microcystin-dependent protein